MIIGLQAPGPWRGDAEVNLGDRHYAVVRADSALEFREALAEAEAGGRPTVVLTTPEQAELGHDVVARLARSKLWPVDAWEGVKGLFKARQLDPALREACLAHAVLEHQPPGLLRWAAEGDAGGLRGWARVGGEACPVDPRFLPGSTGEGQHGPAAGPLAPDP